MTAVAPSASGESRLFALLFAGYALLVLYPILRADRFWNDDLVRASLGNYGWNHNGRPLANAIMRLLELGSSRAVDISPLPQLLAVAVLAWTGVLLARRYRVTPTAWAVAVALPLGAQPFFLENLAYKFDAVCMALALLLALVPVLGDGRGARPWSLGTLALLGCLTLYQPAFNAFLVFALLEAHLAQARGDGIGPLLRGLARRGAQALLALLVYRATVAPSMQDWVAERSRTLSLRDWQQAVRNLADFGHYMLDAFAPVALAILLLPLLLAAFCVVRAALAQARAQVPRAAAGAHLAVGALLLLALPLAVCGPMLLLAHPVLEARVLPGVGALLAASLIAAAVGLGDSPRARPLAYASGALLALSMAVHAAAFGNACAAQRRFEAHIAATLADDLAQMHADRPLRHYAVAGSAGLAPIARHAASRFPLLTKLIRPYLQQDDFHSRNFLRPYLDRHPDGTLESVPEGQTAALLAQACGQEPLIVRSAYRLQRVADVALVRFERGDAGGAAGDACAR